MLQYLLLQYNTIQLKGNIIVLHIAIYIAIYCDILHCLIVVNVQSLYRYHKNDKTSRNLDYTLKFFTLLYSFTGCSYILFFTAKTHIPI